MNVLKRILTWFQPAPAAVTIDNPTRAELRRLRELVKAKCRIIQTM